MFARGTTLFTRILYRKGVSKAFVTQASKWDLRRRNVVSRVSKWGHPLKAILLDYIEVTKDLLVEAKQRPLKTVIYLVTGSLIVTTWRRRPSYESYLKEVMEYSNEMGMCNESLLNPQAKKYIDRVIMLKADGYLRYVNLGLVGIVVRRNYSPNCANYAETCEYLQPRIWRTFERIIDVGVWGRWVQLDKRMVDFDVNEEELNNNS